MNALMTAFIMNATEGVCVDPVKQHNNEKKDFILINYWNPATVESDMGEYKLVHGCPAKGESWNIVLCGY